MEKKNQINLTKQFMLFLLYIRCHFKRKGIWKHSKMSNTCPNNKKQEKGREEKNFGVKTGHREFEN